MVEISGDAAVADDAEPRARTSISTEGQLHRVAETELSENASSPGCTLATPGVIRGLTREIRDHALGEPPLVIGTGGSFRLFEREDIFIVLQPDLVLIGLERALSPSPAGSARRAALRHERWRPDD